MTDDERYMALALDEARLAAEEGEVPIGAVVVCDGEVVARAHNRRETDLDPSAHAEFSAMVAASQALGRWRLTGCTVYVTLEPCIMCAGLMVNARIDRCVYGAPDPKGGALGTLYDVSHDERLNHEFEVTPGVLADESAGLLREFFRARRKKPSAVAGALLAALLCLSITPLAGCGSPTDDAPQDQPAEQEAPAEEPTPAEEPMPTFEVADCHLAVEGMSLYADIPDGNPDYPGGRSLSLLIEEADIPVVVTPYGTVSGLEVSLGYGNSSASPVLVRFEPVDDVPGYAVRATFFYVGRSADDESNVPEELLYQEAEESGSHTFPLFDGDLPLVEAADEWPSEAAQDLDLSVGAATVPLEDKLVLLPSYFALGEGLGRWAEDLFGDCYQKLVDAGSIELPQEGDPNEFFVFDDEHELRFLDEELGARLSADLSVDLDDVIFCAGNRGAGLNLTVYLDPFTEGEYASYPRFYPATYMISGSFADPIVVPEGAADRFADSLDECRYVVAYVGLYSRVEDEFYMGGADRTHATTLVVVMDAQNREFVHIRNVGTDVPPTTTQWPTGGTLYQEAQDYMGSLL